jgi:hypothetical protein
LSFLPLLGAILAGVFGTALLKGPRTTLPMHTTLTDHHHDHGPSRSMYHHRLVALMLSACSPGLRFH